MPPNAHTHVCMCIFIFSTFFGGQQLSRSCSGSNNNNILQLYSQLEKFHLLATECKLRTLLQQKLRQPVGTLITALLLPLTFICCIMRIHKQTGLLGHPARITQLWKHAHMSSQLTGYTPATDIRPLSMHANIHTQVDVWWQLGHKWNVLQ